MPPTILYEDQHWDRFLPLVHLRGIFELRCGAGELWQRVERLMLDDDDQARVGLWCRPQLADLVAEQTGRIVNQPPTGGCLLLCGRAFWAVLPTVDPDESSWVGTAGAEGDIVCLWADSQLAASLSPQVMLDAAALSAAIEGLPRRDVSNRVESFGWPWDVVNFNTTALESDWRLASLRGSTQAPPGVYLLNPGEIHIGAGTRIKPCVVIDAEEGPVWIGANVTIQPHAYIQGPCYIGNESLIQTGAIIREGCSFGRRCKVGGEVEASIIQSFSNKQHDGFLGHAYLSSWINMGAGCINSDLKNTYGTVRVPVGGKEVETGLQFVGMMMGDFSKTGINVSFPTGAVIGVCTNVVVPSPPKYLPDFTWLDENGPRPFDVERGLASARKMMSRRNREVTPALEAAMREIHSALQFV